MKFIAVLAAILSIAAFAQDGEVPPVDSSTEVGTTMPEVSTTTPEIATTSDEVTASTAEGGSTSEEETVVTSAPDGALSNLGLSSGLALGAVLLALNQ